MLCVWGCFEQLWGDVWHVLGTFGVMCGGCVEVVCLVWCVFGECVWLLWVMVGGCLGRGSGSCGVMRRGCVAAVGVQWTHWGLNTGHPACQAGVIPPLHVPGLHHCCNTMYACATRTQCLQYTMCAQWCISICSPLCLLGSSLFRSTSKSPSPRSSARRGLNVHDV